MTLDALTSCPPSRQVVIVFLHLDDIVIPCTSIFRETKLRFSDQPGAALHLDDTVGSDGHRWSYAIRGVSRHPSPDLICHVSTKDFLFWVPARFIHECQDCENSIEIGISSFANLLMIVLRTIALGTQRFSPLGNFQKCGSR